MKVLERAKFGQTEVGSFVLSIECRVPPRLQQGLLPPDGDPEAPLERKTFLHLARALYGMEQATRASTTSGMLDPFRERSQEGVSANLCDAVAEVLEASAADRLTAGFSFAARRPVAVMVPRSVAFPAETASILRGAAAGLREEAGHAGAELEGTLIRLESGDPAAGGSVVLRADVEGRDRSVRLLLEPGAYQDAIRAHGARARVRCRGDLAREGRSWMIRHPEAFLVLADPANPSD
jgi:hypothetical protein